MTTTTSKARMYPFLAAFSITACIPAQVVVGVTTFRAQHQTQSGWAFPQFVREGSNLCPTERKPVLHEVDECNEPYFRTIPAPSAERLHVRGAKLILINRK